MGTADSAACSHLKLIEFLMALITASKYLHACAEWCIVCFVGNPPKLIDILPDCDSAPSTSSKGKGMVAPARRSQSTSSLTATLLLALAVRELLMVAPARRSQSTSFLTATLLLALAVRERVKFLMVAPARRSQSTSFLTPSPSSKGKGKVPYGGSSKKNSIDILPDCDSRSHCHLHCLVTKFLPLYLK